MKCGYTFVFTLHHYNDVIISTIASQITSLTVVYSTVYSRHRSKKTSKLRATGLCVGNSPGPVNSPHKGPVTRKCFHLMTLSLSWAKSDIWRRNCNRKKCLQNSEITGTQSNIHNLWWTNWSSITCEKSGDESMILKSSIGHSVFCRMGFWKVLVWILPFQKKKKKKKMSLFDSKSLPSALAHFHNIGNERWWKVPNRNFYNSTARYLPQEKSFQS